MTAAATRFPECGASYNKARPALNARMAPCPRSDRTTSTATPHGFPRVHPAFRRLLSSDLLLVSVLGAIFVALTLWSWRKWPDPLIDFGREIYTPWQLASGKALYTDIHGDYGPFSAHLHAALFSLFGPSLSALIISGLAVAAASALCIYCFFRKACDKWTAFLCVVVFFSYSAFAHLRTVGNYNWICPYSYSYTHGAAIAFVMLVVLQRLLERPRKSLVFVWGLCVGFILLTRFEVTLAALVSAAAGWFFILLLHRPSRSQILRLLTIFVVGVMAPTAAFFLYLGRHMTVLDVCGSLFGSWPLGLDSNQWKSSLFYAELLGLDSVLRSTATMGVAFLGVAGMALCFAMIDYFFSRRSKRPYVPLLIAAGSLIGAWSVRSDVVWLTPGRSFTLATAFLGVLCAWRYRRERPLGDDKARYASLVLLALFAFGMLAKMILAPSFRHYGFVLATASAMFLVSGWLWILPRMMGKARGGGRIFRILASTMLFVDIGMVLSASNQIYAYKTIEIGNGSDRFLGYSQHVGITRSAHCVNALLRAIGEHAEQHSTLAVLPEGVMVNYLLRIPSTIPYLSLMPTEIQRIGEERIVRALESTPPDYIAIVPKDSREFGVGRFGTDARNGLKIYRWVREHYTFIWQEGGEYGTSLPFRMKLYRKRQDGLIGYGAGRQTSYVRFQP